jgi:putative ubiquitin-RnfH superfamily antitoxin RatB of RatAB toxin-antitoxin module
MFVKVIRVPGAVKEVGLEDGATVADALEAAELQKGENEALKVGSKNASLSDALSDGDIITISKGAKGNT